MRTPGTISPGHRRRGSSRLLPGHPEPDDQLTGRGRRLEQPAHAGLITAWPDRPAGRARHSRLTAVSPPPPASLSVITKPDTACAEPARHPSA